MQPVTKSKGFIKMNPHDFLTFENVSVKGKDFSGQKCRSFAAINSRFENCKFEKMRIEEVCFGGGLYMSVYDNCSFDNSFFNVVNAGSARFVNCTFRNIDIREMFCFSAEFINCIFSGKMRRSVFNGSVLQEDEEILGRIKNEFYGNDFTEVEMQDCDFRTGIDLSRQKLPNTSDYLYVKDPEKILNEMERTIYGWDNVQLKKAAEITLKIGRGGVSKGQKQLFFIKKDMKPEVFNLLAELIVKN